MPYPRQPTARYPLDLLLVIIFSNVQMKERERKKEEDMKAVRFPSHPHTGTNTANLCVKLVDLIYHLTFLSSGCP